MVVVCMCWGEIRENFEAANANKMWPLWGHIIVTGHCFSLSSSRPTHYNRTPMDNFPGQDIMYGVEVVKTYCSFFQNLFLRWSFFTGWTWCISRATWSEKCNYSCHFLSTPIRLQRGEKHFKAKRDVFNAKYEMNSSLEKLMVLGNFR